MSIDRLLHLTIKHLLFLQCVTRHAKRFVQTDELKVKSLLVVFFVSSSCTSFDSKKWSFHLNFKSHVVQNYGISVYFVDRVERLGMDTLTVAMGLHGHVKLEIKRCFVH